MQKINLAQDLADQKRSKKKSKGKKATVASNTPNSNLPSVSVADLNGLIFANPNAIYDSLYRQRIKQMEVKLKSTDEKSQLIYGWMNREQIKENETFKDFDPLKTISLPDSDDVLLYRKTQPLIDENAGSKPIQTFPNLALICDNSGSMDWDPLTGTGKYDSLIITVYSLLEWLKKKKFAPVIEYNLTCFSSTTRTTGWIDYYHIQQLFEVLFAYEGQSTEMDINILEDILVSPKDKAIGLISDGEIANYIELKILLEKYKNKLKFILIQIGTESKFMEEIEKLGLPAIMIDNINDLSKIVLTFVEKVYSC